GRPAQGADADAAALWTAALSQPSARRRQDRSATESDKPSQVGLGRTDRTRSDRPAAAVAHLLSTVCGQSTEAMPLNSGKRLGSMTTNGAAGCVREAVSSDYESRWPCFGRVVSLRGSQAGSRRPRTCYRVAGDMRPRTTEPQPGR